MLVFELLFICKVFFQRVKLLSHSLLNAGLEHNELAFASSQSVAFSFEQKDLLRQSIIRLKKLFLALLAHFFRLLYLMDAEV